MTDVQPDLFEARAEGDAAAQECEQNAEARGWDAARAESDIVAYLEAYGPTAGEVLVNYASRTSELLGTNAPHDARAFGAVFGRLAKRGRIVKHGFVQRTKGHGTCGGIVWRLA